MRERFKFSPEAPKDDSTKSEVLDAVKEASVHIMKKFSIDVVLMEKAALATQDAFGAYKRLKPTDNEMRDLRDPAVDVVEAALSEKGMHVPEIMQDFEKKLDDRLPA